MTDNAAIPLSAVPVHEMRERFRLAAAAINCLDRDPFRVGECRCWSCRLACSLVGLSSAQVAMVAQALDGQGFRYDEAQAGWPLVTCPGCRNLAPVPEWSEDLDPSCARCGWNLPGWQPPGAKPGRGDGQSPVFRVVLSSDVDGYADSGPTDGDLDVIEGGPESG